MYSVYHIYMTHVFHTNCCTEYCQVCIYACHTLLGEVCHLAADAQLSPQPFAPAEHLAALAKDEHLLEPDGQLGDPLVLQEGFPARAAATAASAAHEEGLEHGEDVVGPLAALPPPVVTHAVDLPVLAEDHGESGGAGDALGPDVRSGGRG